MKYLIVDDDRPCRDFLLRMLSPYAECDMAEGGLQAIEAVQRAWEKGEPYDLVCLDIVMPRCDGHEVLKSIRLAEHQRGIGTEQGVKIVMTTALGDTANLTASVCEGCQSYVTKPIDEHALLTELRVMGALPSSDEPHGSRATSRREEGDASDDGSLVQAGGQGLRFLVVDDDLACRELLKRIIAPFGKCDVAVDGGEAIDAVHLALEDDAPYDLVCLDIMMPGTDGHEALEAIRKLERDRGIWGLAGTKVIMTTALKDPKHCVRSFREGCESYLTKPVDEEDLIRQMQTLGILAALGA